MYLNGEPVAMKFYGTGAGWYYYLNDHLGTPQKIVNASGITVWEAGYTPFGQAGIFTADIENSLRFPGQYYDKETGLHYNYHRCYDPDTGRYLTPDPIGLAGGINLYAYVNGNPVNMVDPEGLAADFSSFNQYKVQVYTKFKQLHSWLMMATISFLPIAPGPFGIGNGGKFPGRCEPASKSIHSKYADGTTVYKGEQPSRLGAPKPDPSAEGAHSRLRWDTINNRVYQAREFDSVGNPVHDIDFTSPTYPNGNIRPDHISPPHQHNWLPVNPNNPKAGFRRSKSPSLLGD
jgi:RHS repeat-associated protein